MTDLESPKPLSAITEAHDATHPATDDLPLAPIASEQSASIGVSSVLSLSSDPAAGPRTTTLAEPNPGSLVAASAALTTGPADPAPTTNNQSPITNNQITIDDFAKVDLRVAQILVCERIPKADKLLRLEVDLGYEKRQILSGIAEWYTPEELIGRRIVVIVNLAPRKMRGLESHGMLLAASTEGGKPYLATFADADTLPLGSRLK
jgi:methionyl-tRNA synthetase